MQTTTWETLKSFLMSLINDIFSLLNVLLSSSMILSMTYDEFQRQVGKSGMTINEFAKLVKMNRVSLSNNKKKGDVPSHLAVIAVLLGEMAEQRIDFRSVLSRIDIAPKRPRGAGVGGKFGGDKQDELFPSGR